MPISGAAAPALVNQGYLPLGGGRMSGAIQMAGPIYDPRSFGAAGSGDDTVPVQAAVNAAAATSGGVLLDRLYTVTQVRLKSRVNFMGTGYLSGLIQKANTSGHLVVMDTATEFWCRISNMLLDGNKANQSTANDVINFDQSASPGDKFHRIDNLYVREGKGNGIYLPAGPRACLIADSYIYDNDGYGVRVVETDQIIRNLNIGFSGLDGLYVTGQASRITDVVSFSSGGAGIRLGANNLQVIGAFPAANDGDGFLIDISNGSTIIGMCESAGGAVIKASSMHDSYVQITIGPGASATSTYAIDLSGGGVARNLFRLGGYTTAYTTFANGSLTGNDVWMNLDQIEPANQTYTVTNGSTDRALNVTGDTTAQVAAVLGTLLGDLQSKNIID